MSFQESSYYIGKLLENFQLFLPCNREFKIQSYTVVKNSFEAWQGATRMSDLLVWQTAFSDCNHCLTTLTIMANVEEGF